MTRTERKQRIQRGNGRTAGDREPGRIREGGEGEKGGERETGGDQNHHRTVKIAHYILRERV